MANTYSAVLVWESAATGDRRYDVTADGRTATVQTTRFGLVFVFDRGWREVPSWEAAIASLTGASKLAA